MSFRQSLEKYALPLYVCIAILVLYALVATVTPVSKVAASSLQAPSLLGLDPGETQVFTCPLGATMTSTKINDRSYRLSCSGGTGTATPTSAVPTVTPTSAVPTVTPTPMTHDPADLTWHAPGAHGDRPAHEHGDAAPSWVTAAGYTPSFTHVAGTPNENHVYFKHTAFKSWAGRFGTTDWFGIFHLDFNPGGHQSRFHSYQIWFKDQTGAVSHMHGWLDFGEGMNTLPNLRVVCGKADPIRPVIQANKPGCIPVLFETWYANAANPGLDIGFSVSPNFFAGGDPTAPGTWIARDRVHNTERRVEFAYYGQWGGVRKTGTFWTTQLGSFVSGPDDPLCGTSAAIGDRTYPIVCITQTIQPTLPEIRFPGNAIQRVFPGAGVVVLPN